MIWADNFIKENTRMVNKHMKRYPTLLVGEIQINTDIVPYQTTIRMTRIKKTYYTCILARM